MENYLELIKDMMLLSSWQAKIQLLNSWHSLTNEKEEMKSPLKNLTLFLKYLKSFWVMNHKVQYYFIL